MDKRNFAFSKTNYILLIAGMAIVIIGFILMSGGSSTEEAFNPDIFSDRRIKVGPMISLLGFISIVGAIMWKPKEDRKENNTENTNLEK
ncbi:MAG: hypothetical protein BHV77_08705 [Bacteroides sp. 43_108]|nr:MAG: hypothetical protein BHV77_08705 [Bacteroides sp. 43_108]